MVHGCDVQTGHDYRVPKRAIKIRNEDLLSCSSEGFDVRVNLATRLRRPAENFVRCRA